MKQLGIRQEAFPSGASVSIVDRRHDMNANLVLTRRQKYYDGPLIAAY